MRPYLLLLASCLFLLSGCAPVPASEAAAPSEAPAAPLATVEPQLEATHPPYSGPNPRLALLVEEADGDAIQVIELGSEEVVAHLPLGAGPPQPFYLSPDGRQLFSAPGVLFDLEGGARREVDLLSQLSPDDNLNTLAWSPSQTWLSLNTFSNAGNSLWLYNVETGELAFVDEIDGLSHWSSVDDSLWYVRASEGSPRIVYHPASGERETWPMPSGAQLIDLLTHDGLAPEDFTCTVCDYPELGVVREYISYTYGGDRIHYQLLDIENLTELAHVAIFHTPRQVPIDYNLDVYKLLPIWSRGDYLLFVHERTGGLSEDVEERFFAAWSPEGRLPFAVIEGEDANKLPDVMPIALSPDERSFVGYRIAVHDFVPWFTSVVVVDLESGAVLYEYTLPAEAAAFFPPRSLHGTDLVWPSE
ncbi:MAG: hypothetical protein KIS85_05100 [Anaerolineales bacterium]|nr:hypothetical protein [Anaerolineales bacterium]